MFVYEDFEKSLSDSGLYITKVNGHSMYPMLRFMKDPVLIYPVTGQLRRYDVAVYALSDRYVVHRVLKVERDHYIIRGDNCFRKEYVPKDAVRGVVAGFWRFGRFVPVSDPLYKAYSRFWVFINPLVCLCNFCLRLFGRALRRLRSLAFPRLR